jgi:hypothetical protein
MTAPITWAEASSPIYWSNIGIDWDSPAKTETSIFTVNSGLVLLTGVDYIVAINFGVNLTSGKNSKHTVIESISYGLQQGYSNFGGFTISGSVQFDINGGLTSNSVLAAVGSATYGIENNYINNTNHSETTTIGITMTYSNGDSLLWNPVEEPSSIWTKIDYPN